MSKLKKLWNENRVMVVLSIIVVICFVVIFGVVVQYFFGSSSSSYGERLDDIQDIPFDEEAQTNLKGLLENENLVSQSVEVRGKIIYVVLKYSDQVALDDAKSLVEEAYLGIDEKYRLHYDFNVTLMQDKTEEVSGYLLMGAKNVSSENFVWSNNRPVTSEEES